MGGQAIMTSCVIHTGDMAEQQDVHMVYVPFGKCLLTSHFQECLSRCTQTCHNAIAHVSCCSMNWDVKKPGGRRSHSIMPYHLNGV
jgi:hypothetical protein